MPTPNQFMPNLSPASTSAVAASASAHPSSTLEPDCLHALACQTTLYALVPGTHATVVCVNCPARMRKRLAEMGVLPGVNIQMKRVAPLGDPIAFQVRGYQLSLRREDAAQIIVRAGLPTAEPENAAILETYP